MKGQHCATRLREAGRELFARHGYEGTSIRAITARARANLGAVTYHYESKELLYINVLQHLVGPLGARVEFASRADRPPLDRIEFIVRAFFEHIRQNPDMPPLMLREMASGRIVPGPVAQTMKRLLATISGVIAEGQANGTIRPGDPLLMSLSTIAQPVYLNLVRRNIAAVAGLDQADQAVMQRVIEHAVKTVRASLAS